MALIIVEHTHAAQRRRQDQRKDATMVLEITAVPYPTRASD